MYIKNKKKRYHQALLVAKERIIGIECNCFLRNFYKTLPFTTLSTYLTKGKHRILLAALSRFYNLLKINEIYGTILRKNLKH